MATTKSTSKKKTTTKAKAKKPVAKKKTTKSAASAKKSTAKKVVKNVFKSKYKAVNTWNWVLAGLHAAQGALILFLSRSDSLFPVTTNFLTQDKLSSIEGAPVLVQAQKNLVDVNLAYIVAAFFFMSAVAHLLVATLCRKHYEADLDNGINRARWYEYSISASTMMVGIAMLTGVSDLSTLVMIFGATAVMNLLGLVMEIHNTTTKKTNWISYIVGTIAGLGPWAVVEFYLFGTNQYGEGSIPTFVYWIFVSIFLFFSSFAVNMYLQYKQVGRWSEYLYGERAYMVLSLVAKSALAWQIFGGTLRP